MSSGNTPLTVACLCASWCTACREYRAIFDGAALDHPQCRFVWIDVEDSAALLDEIEVENFPTLLVGSGDSLAFFGPVTPHADVLKRLIARRGAVAGEADDLALDLLRRLERLHD
ncbi:MAG: thioredoxin family protein [Burkholderiales bacterium]